jgi:BTB/POZ domain-containing protein KCTD9
MAQRRSLEETWRHLGDDMPRDTLGNPFVPSAMPNYDDDILGFSFFRHIIEDGDFSDLTLPRTYFGRSGFERVNFRNTDLSGSRMCWNDFTECDFSKADLSGCDMRASRFQDCRFDGTVLCRADLRHSSFEGSSFTEADMSHAIADKNESIDCLTELQFATMNLHADSGPEPPGG